MPASGEWRRSSKVQTRASAKIKRVYGEFRTAELAEVRGEAVVCDGWLWESGGGGRRCHERYGDQHASVMSMEEAYMHSTRLASPRLSLRLHTQECRRQEECRRNAATLNWLGANHEFSIWNKTAVPANAKKQHKRKLSPRERRERCWAQKQKKRSDA